jgi:hypothetical protein
MNDDDWYAPRFLETLVAARSAERRSGSGPVLFCVSPFLLFDLARWKIRQSHADHFGGATFFFDRADWEARPFRPLRLYEDHWFCEDQRRRGGRLVRVSQPELFLAVRHHAISTERGHAWSERSDGTRVERWLQSLAEYPGSPETLLPPWAVHAYLEIRKGPAPA